MSGFVLDLSVLFQVKMPRYDKAFFKDCFSENVDHAKSEPENFKHGELIQTHGEIKK